MEKQENEEGYEEKKQEEKQIMGKGSKPPNFANNELFVMEYYQLHLKQLF